MAKILVGNSFPLSLIRRRVTIEPRCLDEFRSVAAKSEVCSFWGHANTVAVAQQFLGIDVAPDRERPVLTLSAQGFPIFAGTVFRQCWILSPNYRPGFRPAVGEEVASRDILDWQVLLISWKDQHA